MKIKKLNPLLPAIVEYEDFEQSYQMFVYINGDDVIIPDDNVVITDEFKKEFLDAWMQSPSNNMAVVVFGKKFKDTYTRFNF